MILKSYNKQIFIFTIIILIYGIFYSSVLMSCINGTLTFRAVSTNEKIVPWPILVPLSLPWIAIILHFKDMIRERKELIQKNTPYYNLDDIKFINKDYVLCTVEHVLNYDKPLVIIKKDKLKHPIFCKNDFIKTITGLEEKINFLDEKYFIERSDIWMN